MNIATVFSRASVGVHAPLVSIETHLSPGLPAFNLVGLPETAVRESKERVRSAIINSGYEFPARRITVNLAPADLPKQGTRFDLGIALGILAASHQIPARGLFETECVAELALGLMIALARRIPQSDRFVRNGDWLAGNYPLTDEVIGLITRLQLRRIEKRVSEAHKIPFTYDDEVIKLIVDRCTELESGGRMIDAILTNTMLPRISQEFLTRMMEAKPIDRVHVNVTEGEFGYAFD